MHSSDFFRWLGLSAVIIASDQITKFLVMSVFQPGEMLPITSFFNLVLVFNRGAAFSFLADAGGWQKWFFLLLAWGISAWIIVMLRRCAAERLQPFALSLVLGGAMGNVIDRLRFDAVADFLDFHLMGVHWPAFNVADSAITVGAILLLWHSFNDKKT